MSKDVYIDAQHITNTLRFVNNRCENSNALYITVIVGDQMTIFLKQKNYTSKPQLAPHA